MTWTERIQVGSQIADLLIKLEVHALALIGMGGAAVLLGHNNPDAKTLGVSLAMTGAGLFGVKKSQS